MFTYHPLQSVPIADDRSIEEAERPPMNMDTIKLLAVDFNSMLIWYESMTH